MVYILAAGGGVGWWLEMLLSCGVQSLSYGTSLRLYMFVSVFPFFSVMFSFSKVEIP